MKSINTSNERWNIKSITTWRLIRNKFLWTVWSMDWLNVPRNGVALSCYLSGGQKRVDLRENVTTTFEAYVTIEGVLRNMKITPRIDILYSSLYFSLGPSGSGCIGNQSNNFTCMDGHAASTWFSLYTLQRYSII